MSLEKLVPANTLRSARGTSRPSVFCHLSVTLLRPTQKLELVGNIYAPSRTKCIKLLGKTLNEFLEIVKVNFISKMLQDTAIIPMEDE